MDVIEWKRVFESKLKRRLIVFVKDRLLYIYYWSIKSRIKKRVNGVKYIEVIVKVAPNPRPVVCPNPLLAITRNVRGWPSPFRLKIGKLWQICCHFKLFIPIFIDLLYNKILYLQPLYQFNFNKCYCERSIKLWFNFQKSIQK